MITLDQELSVPVIVLPTVLYTLALLITIALRWKLSRRSDAQHHRPISARMVVLSLAGLLLVPLGTLHGTIWYGKMRIRSLAMNLRTCTRVEVRVNQDIAQAVSWYGVRPIDVNDSHRLGIPERQFTIDDSAMMRRLASVIETGRYRMYLPGSLFGASTAMGLTLYRASELSQSVEVLGSDLLVIGSTAYEIQDLQLQKMIYASSPQTRLLAQEVDYPSDLASLGMLVLAYKSMQGRYPAPSTWCDELAQFDGLTRKRISDTTNDSPFASRVCQYAMNPQCEPNSPAGTVLLFQSTPGWNQHGGPELLRCTSIGPRGCNVLFNDSTYRFIVEESLSFLKWK